MAKTLRFLMLASALVAILTVSGNALGFQAATPKDTKAGASKAAAAAAMPSDKEIADAKAKGLVWVNTNSKVFHKDGAFYGKTKKGKFMTEADAVKEGNRAAKQPAAPKAKSAPGKK